MARASRCINCELDESKKIHITDVMYIKNSGPMNIIRMKNEFVGGERHRRYTIG